jgi:hypothetical protein
MILYISQHIPLLTAYAEALGTIVAAWLIWALLLPKDWKAAAKQTVVALAFLGAGVLIAGAKRKKDNST